jgi:hypothetical protein
MIVGVGREGEASKALIPIIHGGTFFIMASLLVDGQYHI